MPEERSPRAERPDERAIESALAALSSGALVGLPTETLYGIAARADSREALAELAQIRGADGARRPFELHVFSSEQARPYGALWLRPAERLMDRFWPGPLTLEVPASSAVPPALLAEVPAEERAWIGLRVPATPTARELLRRAPFPIAATSATAAYLAQVDATVRGRLAAALDDATPSLAQPSTVLRIGPGRFEIRREGILSLEDLRRVAGRRVLIVCTGNTCRSPMAEVVLRARLAETLSGKHAATDAQARAMISQFGYVVESAGVSASVGSGASPAADAAVRDLGLSLRDHQSRQLTTAMLSQFDQIYGLSDRHVAAIQDWAEGEILVDRLDPRRDIDDPFGGPLLVYRRALAQIVEAVEARLANL